MFLPRTVILLWLSYSYKGSGEKEYGQYLQNDYKNHTVGKYMYPVMELQVTGAMNVWHICAQWMNFLQFGNIISNTS